jgi:hypothetical protein
LYKTFDRGEAYIGRGLDNPEKNDYNMKDIAAAKNRAAVEI